jgi:hypothetical protein
MVAQCAWRNSLPAAISPHLMFAVLFPDRDEVSMFTLDEWKKQFTIAAAFFEDQDLNAQKIEDLFESRGVVVSSLLNGCKT